MKGDRHTVTIGAIVGVLLAALVWLTPPAGAAAPSQPVQAILNQAQTNLANPNMSLQDVITQALTAAKSNNVSVQDLAGHLTRTLMLSGLAAGKNGLVLATAIAQAFMKSLLAQTPTPANTTIQRAVAQASLGIWGVLSSQTPAPTAGEVSAAIATGLQSATTAEQYTSLELANVVRPGNFTTTTAELYSAPPLQVQGPATLPQGVQQFWSKVVSPG